MNTTGNDKQHFVFTWATVDGPAVERFTDCINLLAFAAGWSTSWPLNPNPPRPVNTLIVVSPQEIRA